MTTDIRKERGKQEKETRDVPGSINPEPNTMTHYEGEYLKR